ncbi:MAG: class I adenylate cyclase [Deltaproteobacteria bacterium]|jgi:adenylate cyclase class 1|nr:class I adenylate cyclase [Deltaproteobacteria bacterium]
MREPSTEKPEALNSLISATLQFQTRNNRARTRDLRALATPGFKQVFDLTPALLHYNHPSLPGYQADPSTPHGLLFYDQWLERAETAASGPWTRTVVSDPVVECLVLIGSSGSVGHTAQSDLDYWVCYRPSRLNGRSLALFREKLLALSQWAMDEHETEANFYPIDLSVLAQGRLETHNEERDGEVAPMLLVEELYRTILYVAGRIPLWCVWPTGRPEKEYRAAAVKLAPLDWTGQPPFYVDLGFPSKPRPQEYLASAMWLTCKSEDNPFKGLLKIMPILEAVETNFASPLLCDIVKEKILLNTDPDIPVDPYIITVDRVIDFVSRKLSRQQLNLVEEAAVLKVLGRAQSSRPLPDLNGNDPKSRVLAKWIREWHWPEEKLIHLYNYDRWSNREQLNQGQELLKLLFSCYMIIANTLMTHFPGQVDAQNEVLAPMAARMLGRLGGTEATVELLPSHIIRQNLSSEMYFRKDHEIWSVFHRPQDGRKGGDFLLDKNIIYQTSRAAKACAWLVSNQLYGPSQKVPLLESPEARVTETQLTEYLAGLAELFPPIKFHTLNPQTIWQTHAQGPVSVTFNFEEPETERLIRTMDVIYRTGWGEMRHQFRDVSALKTEADKIFELSQLLSEACGVMSADSLVFLPGDQPQMSRAFTNLLAALNILLRGAGQSVSKSLIDL